MSNKQLVEYKENIFTRIRNFFKRIFSKKSKQRVEDIVVQNSIEAEHVAEPKEEVNEEYKTNKKEFFDIYEKSKKGEVDLFSLSAETLEKMCTLIEEEIRIKKRNNEIKRKKLEEYKEKIWQS